MAMVPDALTLIDSLIIYADGGYGVLSEELLVDKGTPLRKKSLPFWFYSFSSFFSFFFSAATDSEGVCVCMLWKKYVCRCVCGEALGYGSSSKSALVLLLLQAIKQAQSDQARHTWER